MILLLAAPAAAAPPVRDVVLDEPSATAARISATAAAGRYPVDDGSGATIAVSVTAACQAFCTAADPQRIADFVGTLVHGPEVELLNVQLDAPSQIAFDCGLGAQACYFGGESKIVVNGNGAPARDGASWEFVLGHEYGHHVAAHRQSPPPFLPALDWGTARWSSYEQICRRYRAGVLFPGNEGSHYFRDPGEAFAEAFARTRFPRTGLKWRWTRSLKPDRTALRAIRRDTLDPWSGRTSILLSGRVPPRKRGGAVKSFRTPLDGTVSLAWNGRLRRRYRLSIRNRTGRVLRTSRHVLGLNRQLNYTVCGQSRLRVAIRSKRRRGGAFKLPIQRP